MLLLPGEAFPLMFVASDEVNSLRNEGFRGGILSSPVLFPLVRRLSLPSGRVFMFKHPSSCAGLCNFPELVVTNPVCARFPRSSIFKSSKAP